MSHFQRGRATARKLLLAPVMLAVDHTRTELESPSRSFRPAEHFTGDGVALLVGGRLAPTSIHRDGTRYCVRLHWVDVPQRSPLPARDHALVEAFLRGTCQKVIALDADLAPGTVSSLLSRSLATLGFARREDAVAAGAMLDGQTKARAGRDDSELLLERDLEPALRPFTSAEREVALLLFDGASSEDIARARGTSLRTVANQLGAIFRKTGTSGRLAFVHWALRA